MSITDELRRLLDECGVEWGAEESELDHVTTWNANGGQAMFYESKTTNPNLLQVNYYHLTPEQAVEATLGRGTCRNKATNLRTFWCDNCDCALEDWLDIGGKLVNGLRYCPNCGRRIEVDA